MQLDIDKLVEQWLNTVQHSHMLKNMKFDINTGMIQLNKEYRLLNIEELIYKFNTTMELIHETRYKSLASDKKT